jgi:GT2 family glycosyltransferase
MNEKRTAIIIINYKNYSDTIECLESLLKFTLNNVQIFLLDNFSGNESIVQLQKWIDSSEGIESITCSEDDFVSDAQENKIGAHKLVFIKTDDNKGFANGNNFIIKNTLDKFEYFLLFNNDAMCVNNVVDILWQKMNENRQLAAVTCRINNYTEPQSLQQMGGELLWFGHFKRYNESFLRKCISQGKSVIPVSFATGCILMIRNDILKTYGLLSTTIFFGEEDVELALRFKKNNLKMASVIDAVALHKGGSSQKESSSNYVDAGYAHSIIGRSVMLKSYYGKIHWMIWFCLFKKIMAANILVRRRIGLKRTIKIFRIVNKYAGTKNSITQKDFFEILTEFNQL